jgi:hypothetical protein
MVLEQEHHFELLPIYLGEGLDFVAHIYIFLGNFLLIATHF